MNENEIEMIRLSSELKFQALPEYICSKHGKQGVESMVFWKYNDSKETRQYCVECYEEMIAKHCCMLTEIKK